MTECDPPGDWIDRLAGLRAVAIGARGAIMGLCGLAAGIRSAG